MSRREVLAAAPLLLAAGAARGTEGRTLVAFLTRSGNTQVFAEALSRDLPADLFRIRVADPYPGDYQAHVDRAQRERDAGASPALAEGVENFARYDTVFLGFPIWGGALPAPVRSFLGAHPIGNRTLVPFITHGGFGEGSARDTLARLAPEARMRPAFVLECDQERRQLRQMRDWLARV